MFILLITFLASLVLEVFFFLFVNPEASNRVVRGIIKVLFAVNTGTLAGSIFCFLLMLTYWFLKIKYADRALFIRHGILFGLFVTLVLGLKLLGLLDIFTFVLVLVICGMLEYLIPRKFS
jgi:hypothetical protein